MYSGCDYPYKSCLCTFLTLPSLLHPSISLFFYTCTIYDPITIIKVRNGPLNSNKKICGTIPFCDFVCILWQLLWKTYLLCTHRSIILYRPIRFDVSGVIIVQQRKPRQMPGIFNSYYYLNLMNTSLVIVTSYYM